MRREKAKAENSMELLCVLGGSGKQACWELQFILERTGNILGRWVEMNFFSKASKEETL